MPVTGKLPAAETVHPPISVEMVFHQALSAGGRES
jgi:hypothetical protein